MISILSEDQYEELYRGELITGEKSKQELGASANGVSSSTGVSWEESGECPQQRAEVFLTLPSEKENVGFEEDSMETATGDEDDSTSAKGGQYVCAICMAAFYKPYVLKYHLRLHSGHYPFICRVCGQGSTRVENLIHHQKLHPGFKVCRKCGQSFDEAEFKGHTCIELRPYVCQNCGYGFVRLGMLNAHSRECKDFSCYSPTLREYQYHFKGSYYCHSCNLSFSQLHVLIKHKIKNHADHVPSLYCERGAVVPKEEVLKDKYIFYDLVDKASYKCYFCGEVCPTKVSHDRHVQKCHSIISSFSCKFCDRKFNFKGDLKEHMTRKHPFRMARDHPHKCSTCGMYCITAKQLERHRVTCNAGQIAPTALTSSSGTPSVQDKLQLDLSCRDCKQKFATKFSLKRHMKSRHSTNGSSVVGSSDRPKSVVKDDNSEEQCDAPFAAVDLTEEVFLVVSDNSSDDESPSKKTEELTCSVCEKSFLYKGHLYRHMQRQHNTTDLSYKRYKCGACHKMFFGTDRKSARNHWHKEHSGALNIVEIPPIGASVPVTPKAKGPVIATKVLPPALPKAKGPVIATKVLPPASPKAKGPVIATKVLPPASPKAKGPVIATKVLPLASPKAKGPVSVIATKVLPTKSPDDKILTPVKNKSSKKAGNSDKKFACRVCMKSFWDISEQQNHMIVAHKYIRCKHCQLVFRDASSRNRHIRKFHPSKEAISKKEAASQSQAKSKHAKEKAFDEADKWFKSDTSPPTLPQAKAHVRIIANSAESSLPTTSEGNTEEETTTHLYACSICGREYKIYGCLVNHLEKAHDCPSESLSTVSTHTAMGTSYINKILNIIRRCGVMHVALHSGPAAMLSLERSNKEDASTNITKIDLAGFVSMPFSSLPKEFSKLTGGIVFVCGVCSNTYRKRYLLLYHLRIHLNQFPYTCLNCSSGFETLSSLTFHQIQVHPSNLYCRRCGQSFETLDNHECIEIRPFVCEGCGEGFLVFSKLLEHSDVCEDYSYFSLALREYRFHYKGYYSCHTCTLNFSTLSEMIRHRMALHVDWEMSPSPSSPLSPLSPHTPAQEMQAPPIPSSKPFQTLLSSTRFTKKPLLRLKRVSLHSKNPKLKREVAPEFDMKSPSGFFGGKAHTEKKVDSYVRTEVEEEMDISCSNGISSCNSLALYNEESNSSLAVAEKKEEVLLTFGEGNTNSNNNNNNNPTRRSSKRICDRENLSEWSSLLPNNCKMSDRHRQKLKTMAHSQEYKVHIDPLCIFKQVKDKNSKLMKRSKTVMQHNKTGIDGRADSSSSSMDLLSSFNESSDSAGNGVNDSSGEDVGFHATCNGKTSVSHGRNPFLLCRKMSLKVCPLSANSNSF